MLRTTLTAAFTLAALTTAHAQSDKLGDAVSVTVVDVRYTDGVVPSAFDTAAAKFIDKFPPERKAAFETFAQPRGLTAETTGERVAEFLATENLRSRLTDLNGERKLKIEVVVEKARLKNMMNPLGVAFTPPGQMAPTLTFAAKIIDETTGEVVDKLDVAKSTSDRTDINEAEKINSLNFDTMGFDTNFRVLAGTANALARLTSQFLHGRVAPAGKTP